MFHLDSEERQTNVTKVQPTRQISPYISTDNSGAAVITINNILSGITESVNRLSHLHAHFESDLKSSNEKSGKDNVKDSKFFYVQIAFFKVKATF